jgi:hypothetical protein
MPRTRTDPAAGALAHGPVTALEIERVRTQLTSAEQAAAREAALYWRRQLRHRRKEMAAQHPEPRNVGG